MILKSIKKGWFVGFFKRDGQPFTCLTCYSTEPSVLPFHRHYREQHEDIMAIMALCGNTKISWIKEETIRNKNYEGWGIDDSQK